MAWKQMCSMKSTHDDDSDYDFKQPQKNIKQKTRTAALMVIDTTAINQVINYTKQNITVEHNSGRKGTV